MDANLPGRGKGDYSMWQHPEVSAAIVGLDGQDSDDAKHYMEQKLKAALGLVAKAQQEKGE